jgi:hypothetical protein
VKKTRKDYEEYLNEVLEKQDTPQLSVKEGTYLQKPGTWMRKHDPVQFQVGFQEWELKINSK